MTDLTSQSPRNASQKGDLTSQWHKGELPEETECYVRVNGGIYLGSIRYKNGCHNKKLPYIKSFNGQFITKHVEEVLAEVPDYVEWRNMVNCACEEHEANKRLIEENDNLKKIIGYMIDELVDRKNGASLVDYFSHDLIDEIMEALK